MTRFDRLVLGMLSFVLFFFGCSSLETTEIVEKKVKKSVYKRIYFSEEEILMPLAALEGWGHIIQNRIAALKERAISPDQKLLNRLSELNEKISSIETKWNEHLVNGKHEHLTKKEVRAQFKLVDDEVSAIQRKLRIPLPK